MNSYYDVLQLLKRFGTFIYTGNRQTDVELIQSELKDLFELSMITKEDYLAALLILKKEVGKM